MRVEIFKTIKDKGRGKMQFLHEQRNLVFFFVVFSSNPPFLFYGYCCDVCFAYLVNACTVQRYLFFSIVNEFASSNWNYVIFIFVVNFGTLKLPPEPHIKLTYSLINFKPNKKIIIPIKSILGFVYRNLLSNQHWHFGWARLLQRYTIEKHAWCNVCGTNSTHRYHGTQSENWNPTYFFSQNYCDSHRSQPWRCSFQVHSCS